MAKKKKTRSKPVSDVRQRILTAAEKHFANFGYTGTSLRAIAAEVDVQLSHIYYYFSSKEALYDEVFEHHTGIINERRRKALEELSNGTPDLATLVHALIDPWVSYATSSQASARRYTQMLARLINSTDKASIELIKRHFDPIASEFVDAFNRALPEVDRRTITWGYVLSVGTVLGVLANASRVERLEATAGGREESPDLAGHLVPFLLGGWQAITHREQDEGLNDQPATGSKRAVKGSTE